MFTPNWQDDWQMIALDKLLARGSGDSNDLSSDEVQVLEAVTSVHRVVSGVRDASKQEKEGMLTWLARATLVKEDRANELREKVERLIALRSI
jgi:transcriptional/translational regulatory protein YebC/TACO1